MTKKGLLHACAALALAVTAASCTKKMEQTPAEANDNGKAQLKQVEGRKNFGKEGIITPLPCIMIATYDAEGNPDVMMAAWGGQCGHNLIDFNLSPQKTTDNIRLKKEFTVSFADARTVKESDYFGIVSANDVPDKVKRAGFTVRRAPNVDAPIIEQYPLTLECRVVEMSENGRVVGEIINMSADESILNAEGKVDLAKLQPIIYDSSTNAYRVVGDSVGTAWSSGKVFE